jgi:glucose-6-phosphate-specific signal transduction histidine kinase
MLEGAWAKPWVRFIVVAVAYGLGISLFRQIVIPHFLLLTGVHLAVLLLTRYRDWPALVAGEVVSLIPMSVACVAQWGVLWSVVNLIPGIVIMMPCVVYARKRWRLQPSAYRSHMGRLLLLALIVSVVMTIYDIGTMLITKLPPGYVLHFDHLSSMWFLGNFVGILAVVPTVLCVHQWWATGTWRELRHRLMRDQAVLESIILVVPLLALMVWIGLVAEHARAILQVAMFLPVLYLAMRHGWKGAALGGTASSLAIVILMPANYDAQTIQASVVVAFTISSMLLLGSHIGMLHQRSEQERADVRTALALAQRNVHIGEAQLRMTAQALEHLRDTVQSGFAMMLGRLRALQPAVDDTGYRRHAKGAQDQLHALADGLYPRVWRERGLRAALGEGGLAWMLEDAGMRYQVDVRGPLSWFSNALHLALYRLIVDAVAEACQKRNISDVRLRVRCGEREGRRWALVSLTFRAQIVRTSEVRWDELVPRIVRASSGLGWAAIQDRAATFEGTAREHLLTHGRRVSIVLLDPVSSMARVATEGLGPSASDAY